jgi:hypothetical protein
MRVWQAKGIALAIGCTILVWLVGSFTALQVNPIYWPMLKEAIGRFFCCVLLLVAWAGAMLYAKENW